MRKKILRAVTVFATVVGLLSQTLVTAHASTGYRYWGYFQSQPGSATWTMAMTGPTTNVKDGSVEGWSHTFSNDSIQASAPRVVPNFSQLCRGVKPLANKKRIGVIIDFGTAAIRPRGESVPRRVRTCVQVDLGATGAEALAAAAKVRAAASGFICGINGYPANECSAKINTPRSLAK